MKYATKYMVVPFNQNGGGPSFENPEETQITNLDNEMSSILTKKISLYEKIKLYGQTLARFASVYHPNTFSLPNVLAELANKTSQVEKSISDKLDAFNVKKELKIEEENEDDLNMTNDDNEDDEFTDAEESLEQKLAAQVKLVAQPKTTKRLVQKPKKLDVSLSNIVDSKRNKKTTVHFQAPNLTVRKKKDAKKTTTLDPPVTPPPVTAPTPYFGFPANYFFKTNNTK